MGLFNQLELLIQSGYSTWIKDTKSLDHAKKYLQMFLLNATELIDCNVASGRMYFT